MTAIWTHIALHVRSLDASIAFYTRYANLRVVDRHADRSSTGMEVAWLSDRSPPEELSFVMVFEEGTPNPNARPQLPLGPASHLGFAVASRHEVDDLAAKAKKDRRLKFGPTFLNPYAGYLCIVSHPDGHLVEFSYGQALGESDTHSEAQHARREQLEDKPQLAGFDRRTEDIWKHVSTMSRWLREHFAQCSVWDSIFTNAVWKNA